MSSDAQMGVDEDIDLDFEIDYNNDGDEDIQDVQLTQDDSRDQIEEDSAMLDEGVSGIDNQVEETDDHWMLEDLDTVDVRGHQDATDIRDGEMKDEAVESIVDAADDASVTLEDAYLSAPQNLEVEVAPEEAQPSESSKTEIHSSGAEKSPPASSAADQMAPIAQPINDEKSKTTTADLPKAASEGDANATLGNTNSQVADGKGLGADAEDPDQLGEDLFLFDDDDDNEVEETRPDVSQEAIQGTPGVAASAQASYKNAFASHPVVFCYDGDEKLLFPRYDSDGRPPAVPSDCFLDDFSLATKSFAALFASLRAHLGLEGRDDKYLELHMPQMDLSIYDESPMVNDASLADCLEPYVILSQSDGFSKVDPLRLELNIRTQFYQRFGRLRDAMNSQQGLSDVLLSDEEDSPYQHGNDEDNLVDHGDDEDGADVEDGGEAEFEEGAEHVSVAEAEATGDQAEGGDDEANDRHDTAHEDRNDNTVHEVQRDTENDHASGNDEGVTVDHTGAAELVGAVEGEDQPEPDTHENDHGEGLSDFAFNFEDVEENDVDHPRPADSHNPEPSSEISSEKQPKPDLKKSSIVEEVPQVPSETPNEKLPEAEDQSQASVVETAKDAEKSIETSKPESNQRKVSTFSISDDDLIDYSDDEDDTVVPAVSTSKPANGSSPVAVAADTGDEGSGDKGTAVESGPSNGHSDSPSNGPDSGAIDDSDLIDYDDDLDDPIDSKPSSKQVIEGTDDFLFDFEDDIPGDNRGAASSQADSDSKKRSRDDDEATETAEESSTHKKHRLS